MGNIKNYLLSIVNKGFIYVFVGQFLNKFVSFFGSIFLVRALTKAEYGILGYYENLFSYFFVFAGLGAMNATVRYVVLGKTSEEKHAYFKYIVCRALVVDFTLVAFILIVNTFYPHPEEFIKYKYLMYLAALALPFNDLTSICTLNERAMFDNRAYAVISFLVSFIIVFVRLVAGYNFELHYIFIFQAITYALCGLVVFCIEKKKYYNISDVIKLPKDEKKIVKNYSFQYMLTNGLWAIFMLNDTYLLGRFNIGPVSLANYKVAYVFPGNISIVAIAIGVFVSPYFVKHESDNAWVKNSIKKVLVASALMVGLFAIAIAVLANPIIRLFYGEAYLNILPLMRFMLIPAFLNATFRYTIANILSSMGKTKYNLVSGIIGVIIQVLLDIILIPKIGVYGTVYSNIVAYVVMSSILFVATYKLYYKEQKLM